MWDCETGSAPGSTYSMVKRTAMADPNQLSRQERRRTGHPGRLALCPLGAAELVLDQPGVPRGEHAAHDALHFPLAGRRVGRSPSRQRGR